ncbi:MAG: ATP-binding protein [Cardiobacteriaceae bacterium]|nr:ATP-binding protein [Cardiobacteriaceae bacterium]
MIRPLTTKYLRDLKRVTRATAFRLSLLFTVGISIVTAISMTMIYQTAEQEISEQIDSRLVSESVRLTRALQSRSGLDFYGPPAGVTERVPNEPDMSFCLIRHRELSSQLRRNDMQSLLFLNIPLSDLCQIDPFRSGGSGDAIRVLLTAVDDHHALALGYDTRTQRRLLERMLNMVYFVTIILLIASFFGSFFMSRNITGTIARISSTARLIVDGDFSERIKITDRDSVELSRLAENLNHMLERIESLITSQRQVTNNIAHDLRSPLNRMRSRMEVALLDRKINCDDLRDVIAASVTDAENLLRTFNAMMNIAQVESRARDDFKEISVSTICEDLAEMYEVLSEEGDHQFSHDIESGLNIMGNRQLIAQAITNLLDNAVKYTPKSGKINLSVHHDDQHIVVAVGDNGEGIPDDKREEVLKRFVRLDSARSTPGNGLGLSLVSAIMNLHGGMIHLEDNHPGLRIELWLPTVAQFTNRFAKNDVRQIEKLV